MCSTTIFFGNRGGERTILLFFPCRRAACTITIPPGGGAEYGKLFSHICTASAESVRRDNALNMLYVQASEEYGACLMLAALLSKLKVECDLYKPGG